MTNQVQEPEWKWKEEVVDFPIVELPRFTPGTSLLITLLSFVISFLLAPYARRRAQQIRRGKRIRARYDIPKRPLGL